MYACFPGLEAYSSPTMHGFRVSFLIATAAAAVGVVLALGLTGRHLTTLQSRMGSEELERLAVAEEVQR
jgi:hypothetical protein